jgi:hypothetical protein
LRSIDDFLSGCRMNFQACDSRCDQTRVGSRGPRAEKIISTESRKSFISGTILKINYWLEVARKPRNESLLLSGPVGA